MKKFGKIVFVCFVNLLLIVVFWLISDFLCFAVSLKNENMLSVSNLKEFYKIDTNPIGYINSCFSKDAKSLVDKNDIPLKPTSIGNPGLPVLIMGCSFAYGQYLNYNQNFGYKLAENLHRQVFNTAIPGNGIQHSYYITLTDFFYQQVPPCDTVVYVFIKDHFRRMLGETFYVAEPSLYLHFKYKHNELLIDDYENLFLLFLKKNYTLRTIMSAYNYHYLKKTKNSNKIADEMLVYFLKTRQNLENHWHKKINFVVLVYYQSESLYYDKALLSLMRKLEKITLLLYQVLI